MTRVEQDLAMVPGRDHYSMGYIGGGRLFSYAHQLHAAVSFAPKTVLEIGPGRGVVTAALKAMGLAVTTVDVQQELEPNVVASVTNLPFGDSEFDIVICSQVLEHLPFDQFGTALGQIRRVAKIGSVISLPDHSRHYWIRFRIPRIGAIDWEWSIARRSEMPRSRFDQSGHYWEIGYRGLPRSRVASVMQSVGFHVSRTWLVPELSWHRFFLLDKDAR